MSKVARDRVSISLRASDLANLLAGRLHEEPELFSRLTKALHIAQTRAQLDKEEQDLNAA